MLGGNRLGKALTAVAGTAGSRRRAVGVGNFGGPRRRGSGQIDAWQRQDPAQAQQCATAPSVLHQLLRQGIEAVSFHVTCPFLSLGAGTRGDAAGFGTALALLSADERGRSPLGGGGQKPGRRGAA